MMNNEVYDYREAVKDDILEALNNGDYDYILNNDEYKDENGALIADDDLYNALYDEMWIDDSITGNGSGSYTFNTYKAESNLCHNLDLLAEACDYFGSNTDILKDGAEACDVTIRCLLLGECLSDVLETYNF